MAGYLHFRNIYKKKSKKCIISTILRIWAHLESQSFAYSSKYINTCLPLIRDRKYWWQILWARGLLIRDRIYKVYGTALHNLLISYFLPGLLKSAGQSLNHFPVNLTKGCKISVLFHSMELFSLRNFKLCSILIWS